MQSDPNIFIDLFTAAEMIGGEGAAEETDIGETLTFGRRERGGLPAGSKNL